MSTTSYLSSRLKSSASWKQSYVGGVIHGIAFSAHQALADPNSVLPTFTGALTSSRWVVGLVSATLVGGETLLQLFFAYYLQGQARLKPYLLSAVAIRATAWVILGALAYGLPSMPSHLLLAAFLALLLAYATTGGLGAVAFTDLVAGSIPANHRGRFFGLRQSLGSLTAFGAGYLVRLILEPGRYPFPTNYGLLFLLSGLVLYIGVIGFSLMVEAERPVQPRPPIRTYLRDGWGLVRSHTRFRGLLLMQVTAGAAGMAIPFYILFAREVLLASPATVGTSVAAQVTGVALSNMVWGPVRDRYGSLAVARSALTLDILTPVVAILLGLYLPAAFPLVFFLVGAAHSGRRLGFFNCLVDIAPPALRPTYVGLNGTLTAAVLIFPLLGGFLVGIAGYQATFLTAAALGLIPLTIAIRMPPLTPGR